MLAMPFDEIPYAEMVRFFADRMPGEVLLLGMDGVWEARFRQDFADVVFHSASWQEELPEAWRSRFSLIVRTGRLSGRAAGVPRALRLPAPAVPQCHELERLPLVARGGDALRQESPAARKWTPLFLSRDSKPRKVGAL